jgi:hypothetical protein
LWCKIDNKLEEYIKNSGEFFMIVNSSAEKYKKVTKKKKLRPIWYFIFLAIIVLIIVFSVLGNRNLLKIPEQKMNINETLKINLLSYIKNSGDDSLVFKSPQNSVQIDDDSMIFSPDSTDTEFIEIDIYKNDDLINTSKIGVDISENYHNIEYMYPKNDSIIDSDKVVLSWESDDQSEIDNYNVYFGRTENPNLLNSGYDQREFTVDNLIPGERYFWKIEYVDGDRIFSEGTFSFILNSKPEIPDLIYPQNNSIVAPGNVGISWTCADRESEVLRYNVYFGKEDEMELIEGDYPLEEITINNIEENQKYYWQIEGIDENGAKTKSDLYVFSSSSIPEKANLINPKPNEVINPSDVLFEWEDSKDNLNYNLMVSSGKGIEYNFDGLSEKNHSVDFLGYDDSFNWKVISDNRTGTFMESDSQTFKTREIMNLWENYFGRQYMDAGITSTKGNGDYYLLAGYYLTDDNEEETFISKIDPNGEILNQKVLTGNFMDIPVSMLRNSYGNYILAGYSNSSTNDFPSNNGRFDSWIIEFDDDLNILWQTQLGGEGIDYIYDIAQTADGNYFFTGYTESSSGNISGNHDDGDVWYGVLDRNGNLIWQNYFGKTGNDCGYAVEIIDDFAFVTGYIDNGSNDFSDAKNENTDIDVLLLKIDYVNRELLFSKQFGGGKSDYGVDITYFDDDLYILSGISSGDGTFSENRGRRDIGLLKTDMNGDLKDVYIFGGSNTEIPYCFEVMPNGDFLISASSNSVDRDVTKESQVNSLWVFQSSGNNIKWQNTYQANAVDFSKNISYVENGNYLLTGYTFSYDVWYALIGNE